MSGEPSLQLWNPRLLSESKKNMIKYGSAFWILEKKTSSYQLSVQPAINWSSNSAFCWTISAINWSIFCWTFWSPVLKPLQPTSTGHLSGPCQASEALAAPAGPDAAPRSRCRAPRWLSWRSSAVEPELHRSPQLWLRFFMFQHGYYMDKLWSIWVDQK